MLRAVNGPRTPREYERAIEALMDAHAWSHARWLIRELLLAAPHEHWLQAQLAWTYLADGRYAEALAAVDRAALAAPGCPTVLWYRTEILCALDDRARAESACRALVELGPDVAIGECGVGERPAAELLTEAMQRLARLELGHDPSRCSVPSRFELPLHARVMPPAPRANDVAEH